MYGTTVVCLALCWGLGFSMNQTDMIPVPREQIPKCHLPETYPLNLRMPTRSLPLSSATPRPPPPPEGEHLGVRGCVPLAQSPQRLVQGL